MFVWLYLNMHFNDSLANDGGSKESPERYQKMTTSNTSQIKQWVWNLKRKTSHEYHFTHNPQVHYTTQSYINK